MTAVSMDKDGTGDHARLMDDVYRYQRYIYDLTRKYYLFGRDRLIRQLALQPGARIVEVGCGTGRNLVRIGRLYPGTKLFGLDASAEMLKTATQALSRSGLSDRAVLAHGYAENLTPSLFGETAAFDVVIFPYCLSMIPDWEAALRAAGNALSPKGSIRIVDFGDLTGLGPTAERALRAWLGLFHVSPREELLQRFEGAAGAGPNLQLELLWGRYAFLASCNANGLTQLTNSVAAESHGPGKSEVTALTMDSRGGHSS